VLTLLLGALLEEMLETRKGLVDMTGPGGQGEVDLRSLELLADLQCARETRRRVNKKIKRRCKLHSSRCKDREGQRIVPGG